MLEPLPTLHPPRRPPTAYARNLPARAALNWLAAGWRDFRRNPGPSLAYGLILFALSWAVLIGLHATGLLYLALPSVAGFLIVGPFLALGLYEKSHRLAAGEPVSLGAMLLVRPRSRGQLAYAGLMLGLLVLFWLRAADLLYALLFGLSPFPGAGEALVNVLTTPRGWALIATGSAVGGLFAAFAFAISLFSIPMLMAERRDALTALGVSFAMTTQNLGPALAWGVIVAAGLALSAATGLLGLIVIYPVLGHGTWAAWRAIGAAEATP
ncbi:DUF2189 domain-containing protein [Hoeflea sp.]|uniref:DUF2189 domain-containing protein n=1 Tax=Hoeflea sp. TaxID=1940281 RepID=UPI0019C2C1AD|nr:DUF2189 domain-containing protein [Hoeflea sp.]MBC7285401.1 DUF2189 domain-containing protein [Hoeflea sp.]